MFPIDFYVGDVVLKNGRDVDLDKYKSVYDALSALLKGYFVNRSCYTAARGPRKWSNLGECAL
jgi:hypothetical protein